MNRRARQRSDDQTGVGTFMIAGGSCPHPLYRITGVSPHRRAATADFAEALVDSRRRIRRKASLLGLVGSLPRRRRMVKPRKSTSSSRFAIRVLASLKTRPL